MKKSTKRLFAAVLAAASLLALTACGGGKTEAPKTDDPKTEQPAETSGSKELSVYTAFPESEVIYYFNKSSTISTSLSRKPASKSTMSASPPVKC